ncbi:hypothetical protein [Tropicimonas sp. IMCC6043]|uniref:hypothetical protein n=1 Tax=Tropicimonas sp. IMCC6043 TaxID=2510645 RepID=UPI00101CD4CE|nr:hypothetical protein [Tropicimonas sp. IMCC6043]RYH07615.1 hypothetical protein EU800_19635 [Tropicimonas sp. IMCC6043]
MTAPGHFSLPFVVTRSLRRGFRYVGLSIAVLLGGYGIYSLIEGSSFGRSEAMSTLPVAVAAPLVLEAIGVLLERAFGKRYKIDATGVRFRRGSSEWFEPLSAYRAVAWSETVEEIRSYRGGGANLVGWAIVLRHGSDSARSVPLYSKGLFTSRREPWRARAEALAEALGLPLEFTGSTGAQVFDPSRARERIEDRQRLLAGTIPGTLLQETWLPVPARPDPEDKTPVILEFAKAKRHAWPILSSCLAALVLAAVIQNFARGAIGAIREIHIAAALASAIAYLLVLAWAYSKQAVHIDATTVTVYSRLWIWRYDVRTIQRRDVERTMVHYTRFGVALFTFLCAGHRETAIPNLKERDAYRIQRALDESAIG